MDPVQLAKLITCMTEADAEKAPCNQIAPAQTLVPAKGISSLVGTKCIVRTYSAGVWFGTIAQKDGNEVIVTNARRLWRWWAAKSISLSGVALYGIKHDKSSITAPVDQVWLEAIELIPTTVVATQSLESAPEVQAQ